MTLKGHWCDIIVLNAHASNPDHPIFQPVASGYTDSTFFFDSAFFCAEQPVCLAVCDTFGQIR
jgi:hypothetical protein